MCRNFILFKFKSIDFDIINIRNNNKKNKRKIERKKEKETSSKYIKIEEETQQV